jgi:hypothetical protein
MDKKIAELINNGWNVKFSNQVKRIDSEFVIRTCWKAEYGDERYESQWSGFKDAKLCVKDFIKIAEITMKIKIKSKTEKL